MLRLLVKPSAQGHACRSVSAVKHLTMAEKSLLLGNEAADTLVEYAALVARTRSGDSVSLRAIGVDGAEVEASFLLNSGTVLLVETSTSQLPEPENADVVAAMRRKIDSFEGLDIDWVTANDPFTEGA